MEIFTYVEKTQGMTDEVEMASHQESQVSCFTWLTLLHGSTAAMHAVVPKVPSPNADWQIARCPAKVHCLNAYSSIFDDCVC